MDVHYLSKVISPIAGKYGVAKVSLFGSRANGEEHCDSDYDFVISKGKIRSLFQLAAFIDELEHALGQKVDVITDTSDDYDFLKRIQKDEVVVYEQQR